MKRRLLNVLTALSLTLCLAVAVLWVRSYGLIDWVQWTDHRHCCRGVDGLCPACGYDLRATPDKCPECGAGVSVAPGT